MDVSTTGQGTRRAYLDRLKVELITIIIVGHALLGYSGYRGSWPYQPIRKVRLAPVTDLLLGPVLLPMTLFAMGLFFLISGLLTPDSLARKGTRVFVRDRLLRLGIPFVVWVLLLWPAVIYVMYLLTGGHESYWTLFVRGRLDTGPMWFVEVLLIYSLGYVLWRRLWPGEPEPARLTGRTLVLLGTGVAAGTYLVRIVFPFQESELAHLNLWQWPPALTVAALGVVLSYALGWLLVSRTPLGRIL